MRITFEDVKNNKVVQTYIQKADESLGALGYTEHSFPHVSRVAFIARDILLTLGYDEREAELAQIAGYLHDIGNVINTESDLIILRRIEIPSGECAVSDRSCL